MLLQKHTYCSLAPYTRHAAQADSQMILKCLFNLVRFVDSDIP